MKSKKAVILVLIVFIQFLSVAQTIDTIAVAVDSAATDNVTIIIPENSILNQKAISRFLSKLDKMQINNLGKINVVHIGDSHIQADLMTNRIRKNLQSIYGNAGRGLVFPHNLARTNGSSDIRFSSNASWQNHRIVSPVDGSKVGLSGIALTTKSKDFVIELNAKEFGNFFTNIKIISPNNEDSFFVATEKIVLATEIKIPKRISHKVKRGEAISTIAAKYNISISEIKKANGLKSNTIRAGKSLRIPTNEMQIKTAERSEFVPLTMQKNQNAHFYNTEIPLEKIYIIPNKQQKQYDLNGVVLENDQPGIVYHNIGVNGAKLSDFNKYDLFFEQLKALQPDLVVVSLGTNESFDKMNAVEYMKQLDIFVQNVKLQNPMAEIIISTPPSSLFQRKYPNVFVADYAQKIINAANQNQYAVWDLYSQLGGLFGVNNNFRKGLMANDKVHYSKKGYENQGDLLSEALVKAFQSFINSEK